MIRGEVSSGTAILAFVKGRLSDYAQLLKLRLSFLVAFSSAFGYILASHGEIELFKLLVFSFGGFLISGGSITINQILEREYDKLMKRTQNRPLPKRRVSNQEATMLSILSLGCGLIILLQITNITTVLLSILSVVLYGFVYTPLKRVGSIAVLVGAIPGALPPLLGWTAATGSISYEALLIFGIQFIWQFPHFWAIAWVADEDYKKAGFKLLPFGGKKDVNTAFQIMIYTLFLIPLGLLPAKIGLTGINSAIIATVLGCLFLAQTFGLMKDGSRQSALRIMYGSFIYLPLIQVSFLLDRV